MPQQSVESSEETLFLGSSRMAAIMRSVAWSQTALGAADQWPIALRTMVSVMLRNDQPMAVWWGARCLQLYNDAFRPFLGTARDDFSCLSGAEAWGDRWPFIEPTVTAVLDGNVAAANGDLAHAGVTGSDGSRLGFSFIPIAGDDGRVGGVLVTPRDSTTAGGARSQQRELFRILRDAPMEVSLITIPARRYEFVNRAFVAGQGRDPTGKTLEEAFPDVTAADLDQYREIFDRAFLSEEPIVTSEAPRSMPDGTTRYYNASIARWTDDEGVPRGVITVHIDITEHVSSRHQLEATQRTLEETLRLKKIFVGILGHDLRNPLLGILSTADQLLRMGTDDPAREPIGAIRASAVRMMRMLEALLDLTRARTGDGIPVYPTPLDLVALATQILGELQGTVSRPFVFESSGDARGEWDSDRLGQVLSNLLGNAAHHGDPEYPARLLIDGTAREVVRVEVHNAGTIPDPMLATLFDPFRRAIGSKDGGKPEGLGLGLYIVQQIVQAHRGTVEVQSTSEGTTFTVLLPRTPSFRLPG